MRHVSLIVMAAALAAAACSRSNNLLLGRVEAVVDGHTVVVTDCYRAMVAPPESIDSRTTRFAPCRDAVIVFRKGELSVNGTRYGAIRDGASVTVDHGRVFIDGKEPASR
jgi:hypothetical protein